MAIINKGTAFSNGEQLSASKLNDLVDGATFGTDSVDNASTIVNANGAITVRDSGVTAAKLATGSVTTNKILDDNVTFAKLTDVIDDDTMATATDSTLATSESIKAYVDGGGGFTPTTYTGGESVTLPNGLTMKMGKLTSVQFDQTFHAVNYGSAFGTAVISVQATIHASGTITGTRATVVKDSSTSGFEVAVDYDTNTSSGDINWFAIGH